MNFLRRCAIRYTAHRDGLSNTQLMSIVKTLEIDRSKFPTADDEYTPEQRRIIDTRLTKAEKGPFYGPFRNGAEVAAFIKKTALSRPKVAD